MTTAYLVAPDGTITEREMIRETPNTIVVQTPWGEERNHKTSTYGRWFTDKRAAAEWAYARANSNIVRLQKKLDAAHKASTAAALILAEPWVED